MDSKKKRSCNFTNTEIGLLMQCIFSEIKIIENKKTDGSSLKEKVQAWERVTNTFNATNNSDVYRDLGSIKNKYENIKRVLKKKNAHNRENINKTGGGPSCETKLLWYEEELFAVLQLGIEGLVSEGDSDYCFTANNTSVETVPTIDFVDESISALNEDREEIIIEVTEENDDEADKENQFLGKSLSCANRGANLHIQRAIPTSSWCSVAAPSTSKACKAPEKQPLATTLIYDNSVIQQEQGIPNNSSQSVTTPKASNSSKTASSNRWNLKRKRAVVPTPDTKKMSLDSFQQLTEGKKELLDIQKKCFEVELNLKNYEYKQKEDQWTRIKDMEETELNIKLKTLQELTDESERKKKIFNVMYEKEKISMELMKCELNMKLKKSLDFST